MEFNNCTAKDYDCNQKDVSSSSFEMLFNFRVPTNISMVDDVVGVNCSAVGRELVLGSFHAVYIFGIIGWRGSTPTTPQVLTPSTSHVKLRKSTNVNVNHFSFSS